MASDPRKLRPSELCFLLNSTPLGEVINERQAHRHRIRAGLRIGDGRYIDLLRYVAWLVDDRHRPVPEPTIDPYERMKERARARNAALSQAGRDIGEIPPIVDPNRREAAEVSFRVFCETYFGATFCLAWSDDHLRMIRKTERAVLFGGLFALAMPRGSGKTSMAIAACLWAMLTGEREFVALIGADEAAAGELLESIKTELETNELLLEDFPEACYPIRCLEGIPQRRLMYKGEPVRMEFTAKSLVLPNIPGAASREAVVVTAGITGRIRGMHYKRSDGRSIRPSLVVIDDPQTDESAASVSQCRTREKVLSGAILGLAGPGQKISGIMPCTVIRPADMADRIVNSERYPQWQGERTKLIYSWPTTDEAKALLHEYSEIRANCQRKGEPLDAANEFWRSHLPAIEEGSVAAWPERKNDDDISAVQHAYNLRLDMGDVSFESEYQNAPYDESLNTTGMLTPEEICKKVNGYARGLIPSDASHLSAFIDVQQDILFWMVAAWRGDFTGYIVKYGTYPDQQRSYFSLRDLHKTIHDVGPGGGLESAIFAALNALTAQLLGNEWNVDGGGAMRIGRCMIDANWGLSTSTVYSFARQSDFAATILPSHGRGVKASENPMSTWQEKGGERAGLNWRERRTTENRAPVRHAIYDTNFWKSFIHGRLSVPLGDPGSLSLFRAEPHEHRMLADHLTAEYRVPTEAKGRKVDEWKERPDRPDNHWLDGLVGCAVGASMLGATLPSQATAAAPKPIRLSEIYKLKHGDRRR